DSSLVGEGMWSSTPAGQVQTQVNLVLDISDAGNMLGRFGYPNTVKGGNGRLTANLSWLGTPDEFSYAILNGTLKLNTDKGRFLKMNQGAGKLLSVLSLQDLPKHISLGFTDVFSEGFQFDNINGNATIKNGVIETQDFHILGSSAKVTLKGNVDLNNETQNLRVRIFPAIGDSVSLIGLLAISPPVGIGLLLGNTLLGNPLDKMVSFEYNVSGTLNNPNVVRIK
ncbi:MAG: AsmA-like C-terminal region-containing protein, partial [Gallionella sp.]